MIIVTGGAGFIGSALIAALNERGTTDILAVDEPEHIDGLGPLKQNNLSNLSFSDYIGRDVFLEGIIEKKIAVSVKAVLHLGAITTTTETDTELLKKNNFEYTRTLAKWATDSDVRFIYASSAATYGDGADGFCDDEEAIQRLKPLNPYGQSKQDFDLWAKEHGLFTKIAGLKYFNVFGPNEYHKAEMRSFALKAFEQIKATGKVRLFKSYKPQYKDGQQIRDFIYIKDAVDMTLFFLDNPRVNGLFNIGTARARTWNDLAKAVFAAMHQKPDIEYIDMPVSIRSQYQYYTCADITKLKHAGYTKEPTSLENAVKDYVRNYLVYNACLTGV